MASVLPIAWDRFSGFAHLMIDAWIRKLARLNRRVNIFTPKISKHAIIIGAMKSGTTFLYEMLSQHLRIYRNFYMKDPNFFL